MTAVVEPTDTPDAGRPRRTGRTAEERRAALRARQEAAAAVARDAAPAPPAPPPPPPAPSGRRSPGERYREVVALSMPRGMFPVLVLLGLAAAERFDATALGVLAPEIRHSFGLSEGAFLRITGLTQVVPILFAVPLGYLADRKNRVWISRVGGLVWGLTAVLTGLTPAGLVALLVFARVAGGSGLLVNETAHQSLLSDFYRPKSLPAIFGFYSLGPAVIGLLAGPISGGLGGTIGWRPTFVLLGLPTFVLVVLLARLREPERGASAAAELAELAGVADAPAEASVGDAVLADAHAAGAPTAASMSLMDVLRDFLASFRDLRAIRSLRRTWLAAFFFGGVLPFATLLSLFFENVYKVSPEGRGLITALFGVFGLGGLAVGGKIALDQVTSGHPERLPLTNGLMVIEFGVFVAAMAVAPGFGFSLAAVCALSVGATGFVPAYRTLVALVVPGPLRSQAYAWSLLFLALGAAITSVVVSVVSDADGDNTSLFVLGVVLVIGGAVAASARSSVLSDIAAAGSRDDAVGSDSLLSVRGLDVAYGGGVQVLFGVDFDVRKGEVIALLGTNGAGKSTLLRAVSGLVDPIGGAISFRGRDVTHLDPVAKAKLGIVQVPGGKGVFPGLTVAENLKIAGWLYRGDQAYLSKATEDVLVRFPILRELYDQPAANLSGGQQQMLTIGQALLAKPELLMIDELSLGLAPVIVEQLLGTVRELAAEGTTIILVEQSVNVALTIADTAYFMEKGEVRFKGPTAELLDRPDVLRSVFLEGVGSMEGEDDDERPSGASLVLRERTPVRGPVLLDDGTVVPAVLAARGITKRFGGVKAATDITFDLQAGQILGIIGPNGAGKTTLFDLLCGYTRPDEGQVVLLGEDVSSLLPDARAWRGLGRSFQDARLFPALTVAETVAVAFEKVIEIRDPVAAALSLPVVADAERKVAERVDRLVELMGLGAFRDKFVGDLSTGSRRIVDLACILASEPKVILFDEPSSGIAQRETEALGPLLLRIRDATGASLLVIEHDMPLITGISDEILALDLGCVVLQDAPDVVLHDPRVVSSYLGGSDEVVFRSGAVTTAPPAPLPPRRARRPRAPVDPESRVR